MRCRGAHSSWTCVLWRVHALRRRSYSVKSVAVVLSGHVYDGMLKHYMNQSSMLQVVCTDPALDLTLLSVAQGD